MKPEAEAAWRPASISTFWRQKEVVDRSKAECAKRGLYKGRGRKGIRSSEGDKLRWQAIIHFARCSRPSRTTRPARSNPASARRVLTHAPQQTTHGLHGVTQSPCRQAA